MPSRFTLLALPLASLVVLAPHWADAAAEPGTLVENVELRTLAGGKEKLLSPKVRANVFVFFRPAHDRSLDALKQLAAYPGLELAINVSADALRDGSIDALCSFPRRSSTSWASSTSHVVDGRNFGSKRGRRPTFTIDAYDVRLGRK